MPPGLVMVVEIEAMFLGRPRDSVMILIDSSWPCCTSGAPVIVILGGPALVGTVEAFVPLEPLPGKNPDLTPTRTNAGRNARDEKKV